MPDYVGGIFNYFIVKHLIQILMDKKYKQYMLTLAVVLNKWVITPSGVIWPFWGVMGGNEYGKK